MTWSGTPSHSLHSQHPSKMQTDDLTLMEEMVQPMILEDNTDEEMPLNDHDNDIDLDADMGEGEARKKRSKASNDVATHSRLLDSHIKIALSLYKVQQNIYLLDFQRIEVSTYTYHLHLLKHSFNAGRCFRFHEALCLHHH